MRHGVVCRLAPCLISRTIVLTLAKSRTLIVPEFPGPPGRQADRCMLELIDLRALLPREMSADPMGMDGLDFLSDSDSETPAAI